jgi:hypothetical protein
MARHEAFRCVMGARGQFSIGWGMAAAAAVCLLIPLHRAYGASGPVNRIPYFLIYCLLIQLSLFFLCGRAVWAGMRRDAATGSLEELMLTGIQPAQLLVGKWAGVSAAGVLWTLMLLPTAMLAAAFTRADPLSIAPLLLAWAVSGSAGALIGALLALSERSAAAAGVPWLGVFQVWIMMRLILPRAGAGLGPWWGALLRRLQDIDPLTLVPAAVGAVHEPWWAKALFLLGLMAVALTWLLCGDHPFPASTQRRSTENDVPLLSLRPMRGWVTGRRGAVTRYDREVLFPFERAHGWRLRVSPPIWLLLLSPGLLVALPFAILGREAHQPATFLAPLAVFLAAGISGLGMGASLAAEREQGRWGVLLCAPLTPVAIIWAKWRAAWLETWPYWPAVTLQTLLLAACGALPWGAVPVAALGVPVAAGAAAALAGALCVRTPSLTAAQQRTVLAVVLPPLAAVAGWLLLPGLRGLGIISMPHVVFSAQRFAPGFADTGAALLVIAAYGLSVPLLLGLAAWQLRRWPLL